MLLRCVSLGAAAALFWAVSSLPSLAAPANTLTQVAISPGPDYSQLTFTFNNPLETYTVRRDDVDQVVVEFFELLGLLTQMASIRTIVWSLAMEVKKVQRRVNTLEKVVIPQTEETRVYIDSVLEERERENIFVLKAIKAKKQ